MGGIVKAALIAFCLILAACGTLGESGETMLAARQKQADSLLPRSAERVPPPALIHDSGSVLGVLDASDHGDRLPSRCEQVVVLRSAQAMSFDGVMLRLSQILRVPVQYEPRLDRDSDVPGPKPGSYAGAAPPSFPAGDNPPANSVARSHSTPALETGNALFQPDISGTCTELLDRIAGQFDVDWRMRGGVLSFDRYVMRTFPIRASATTSQFSSTMSSGGNGASASASTSSSAGSAANSVGGAGGSQSASVSANTDIWSEIENGLKNLIAKAGKYSISRAAGTITIFASPRTMSDVAIYLDQMNKILSTTIAVEVSAIYITVNDTDNYGLDLNALYQAGAQKLSLNGLLPTISQAAGTGSIAILSPPAGTNNFATHFAGSQLFLNAVSSSNRLADYRSATVAGRNGVAMPITLTTNQDIVRSLQFAVGLQSGAASTSASTSTINYGFSLQVLPRVIAPGVVSVFLSFTANDLTNLQDFAVGNAGSLELATIDSRSLWNESPLRVGQTLVIAGTEQEKVNPQRSGIGAANNWLLGGQYKNEIIRTRLILLVTPSIMTESS